MQGHCITGKGRHPTLEKAQKQAQKLLLRGTPRRVYPCPDCAGWHLTSKRVSSANARSTEDTGSNTPEDARRYEERRAIDEPHPQDCYCRTCGDAFYDLPDPMDEYNEADL
jgi:hypothetical protein